MIIGCLRARFGESVFQAGVRRRVITHVSPGLVPAPAPRARNLHPRSLSSKCAGAKCGKRTPSSMPWGNRPQLSQRPSTHPPASAIPSRHFPRATPASAPRSPPPHADPKPLLYNSTSPQMPNSMGPHNPIDDCIRRMHNLAVTTVSPMNASTALRVRVIVTRSVKLDQFDRDR